MKYSSQLGRLLGVGGLAALADLIFVF